MATIDARVPPGPADQYPIHEDLLAWMLANFARYGDIYKASIYGSNVYVVSAPEYAEHVLLWNWENYLRKGQAVKRLGLTLGNGLISSNGRFWVNQRRMIQPAFNRNAIGAMRGFIETANLALLGKWKHAAASGASINITRDVSLMVLEVTLRAIFGEDYDRVAPEFQVVAEDSRNMEFAKVCSSLRNIIVQIAIQRRKHESITKDILGTMMQARDRDNGQPMPDMQLAKEAMTLVIAGHETTASVLNWTWYLLATHPEVEAKIAAELSTVRSWAQIEFEAFVEFVYTRQVIEEALRSYPPLWLMTRKALADDRIGDYFVPAGTEIYISPYLMQRHPDFWEAPERFDPDRFSGQQSYERQRLTMCPFGAGPRNCIGEFLARIEMQIHLMTMVRELRMRREESRPPEMFAGVNLLSKDAFIMKPELRVSGGQCNGAA
jgi:cytochrome P450